MKIPIDPSSIEEIQMAIEQSGLHIGFMDAAADLSAKQFYLLKVAANGTVNVQTSAGGAILGVLQNKPESGRVADVMGMGVSKVEAGGTLAAGDPIQAHTDGTAIKALTGDISCGTVLIGAASGALATCLINAGTQNEID